MKSSIHHLETFPDLIAEHDLCGWKQKLFGVSCPLRSFNETSIMFLVMLISLTYCLVALYSIVPQYRCHQSFLGCMNLHHAGSITIDSQCICVKIFMFIYCIWHAFSIEMWVCGGCIDHVSQKPCYQWVSFLYSTS